MAVVLAVMAVVLVGVVMMVTVSEMPVAADSRFVVVVRPPAAPHVPRGRVHPAMTMTTALVAAALMVAVVIVGAIMVVMDSVVMLVVQVMMLECRVLVQVVLLRAQSLGIFLLGYLQAP